VIDDGSKDKTAEIRQRFPSVEWVTLLKSRGYMAARNQWMAQATEEFFVGLDDDAWFIQGDEVATAHATMMANPRIAAVAFDILSPDRPGHQPAHGNEACTQFIGCGHISD